MRDGAELLQPHIVDTIVSSLSTHPRTLFNLLLTSRTFYPAAARHLYAHLHIYGSGADALAPFQVDCGSKTALLKHTHTITLQPHHQNDCGWFSERNVDFTQLVPNLQRVVHWGSMPYPYCYKPDCPLARQLRPRRIEMLGDFSPTTYEPHALVGSVTSAYLTVPSPGLLFLFAHMLHPRVLEACFAVRVDEWTPHDDVRPAFEPALLLLATKLLTAPALRIRVELDFAAPKSKDTLPGWITAFESFVKLYHRVFGGRGLVNTGRFELLATGREVKTGRRVVLDANRFCPVE